MYQSSDHSMMSIKPPVAVFHQLHRALQSRVYAARGRLVAALQAFGTKPCTSHEFRQ